MIRAVQPRVHSISSSAHVFWSNSSRKRSISSSGCYRRIAWICFPALSWRSGDPPGIRSRIIEHNGCRTPRFVRYFLKNTTYSPFQAHSSESSKHEISLRVKERGGFNEEKAESQQIGRLPDFLIGLQSVNWRYALLTWRRLRGSWENLLRLSRNVRVSGSICNEP